MNSPMSNRRMLAGLVLALVAWGIFLAIGATGYFADAFNVKTSYQKSLIVLLCMAAFLGLWGSVTWLRRHRPTEPAANGWSISGLVSLALKLIGIGLWVGAIVAWELPPPTAAIIAGWTAIAFAGAADVAAFIGLSEPGKRRGKWAGLISLGLSLLCVMVFVVRTLISR